MVSARPAPKVAGGRTAYPTAQTYTPGDVGESPEAYRTGSASDFPQTSPAAAPHSPPTMTDSTAITKVTSNESDKAGLMTWFKGFRDRSSSEPQRMG